jgi:uncharacterized zinc-type alcohol dehydrogenase-like protein
VCEWCGRGREHLCLTEEATIVGRHGGWADSVRVKSKFAIPIPEAIPSEFAGPLMCAGSTVFSPMLHYGVTSTMRTAVVGVGGLGHLAVQYQAAFGCEVTAISSTHNKDEEARKFGARHFIATRGTDELAKAANSFDFIISTAPGSLDWPQFINALRPGGQLVIVGVPDADLKFNAFGLIGKEKSVRGGRLGSPSDTAQQLEFVARHNIRPMIEKFPMGDINAAVDRTRSGKARYRVVLEA